MSPVSLFSVELIYQASGGILRVSKGPVEATSPSEAIKHTNALFNQGNSFTPIGAAAWPHAAGGPENPLTDAGIAG